MNTIGNFMAISGCMFYRKSRKGNAGDIKTIKEDAQIPRLVISSMYANTDKI